MALNVFGFEIKRSKADKEVASVIAPTPDDGSTVVNSAAAYYGLVIDLEGVVKNENDLIRRYRESAQYGDCDSAIEDIVNEAIIAEPDKPAISLILDDLKVSETIKKKIRDEFDDVLRLYKIEERGHDLFRQWYIDGRMFFHVILDKTNKSIAELRYVDPRKIRKIKNVKTEKDPKTGVDVIKEVEEYYLYNDNGIKEQTTQGVKMSVDSIILSTSGLIDSNTNMVLSYLHKAIKPVNQLKMMEDALVIYRISRAPERRIFYIDVGNLPKARAEQYVDEIMNKFRNKIVYDAATGEIKDNRQQLSLQEDFWMPRREGGKGTEITTLAGGANLSQMDDVNYFQRKLYQTLNVPLSRLQPDQGFNLGRSNEISREEIKFNKFIERLRKKFATLFRDALKIQLIVKGIIRPDEWDEISQFIKFDFQRDNHFAELKDADIMNSRLALIQSIDPYVGKYYSINWIRKNVLKQTEEVMKILDKEMLEDREQQLDLAAPEGQIGAAQQAAMNQNQGDEE